ncbi:MAG TPA: DNA-binding protein [Prolixibacteraceae bacterium]|nr:DNA-binding protein [Prolixibacteraceae bacterium]
MLKLKELGFAMLLLVLAACSGNQNNQSAQVMPGEVNAFIVSEVIHGSQYTYLQVNENGASKWMAVVRQEVKAGDKYYYDSGLEMKNFHSKELDRTFEVIYFVNKISKTQLTENLLSQAPGHTGKVDVEKQITVQIEKQEGELTIGEIFGNPAAYADKEVELRGVVVKVNQQIMGKNWVHLQDGTGNESNFDLTVTTQDMAAVNDQVTFKGKIVLNKDFGAGYKYDILMEEGTLKRLN